MAEMGGKGQIEAAFPYEAYPERKLANPKKI